MMIIAYDLPTFEIKQSTTRYFSIHKENSLGNSRVTTDSRIPHWCAHTSLQWRHNERDGISNYQPHNCLFNPLFRRRSKNTSKLRVTGLCVGNSPVIVKFLEQRASNAENVPFDDIIMMHSDNYWNHKQHSRNVASGIYNDCIYPWIQ